MRCDEIMKRDVRTVREDADVASAARLMRDADVGFLPVCGADGRVVGVITDRDIAVRVCASDLAASRTKVTDVMTRAALSCEPTHTLAHAESLMREHRVTRVLVVDEAGVPAGVVSLSDLAQYEPTSRIGHVVRDVTERKYAPERP